MTELIAIASMMLVCCGIQERAAVRRIRVLAGALIERPTQDRPAVYISTVNTRFQAVGQAHRRRLPHAWRVHAGRRVPPGR
jgi:hypothetical protein